MSFELHVQPGEVMTWRQLKKEFPGNTIALDGFVGTGPKFDLKGPYANFNHHEGVSRLETRATCAQVLLALRQGLYACFKHHGEKLYVCVNDCDQDVCLSVFLLKNSHLAINTMNPLLNQLVSMEDFLDATAGAYAFPSELLSLAKLMWVFEPYTIFRNSGGLTRRRANEYEAIIADVEHRIMRFITGSAQSIILDTSYNVIHSPGTWKMVEETGQHARISMFADGVQSFVSVKQRDASTYQYTIGRVSQFINFPLEKIYKALNEVENIAIDDTDRWGGGNTVGGSPRIRGSKLSPEDVARVIDDVLMKCK